MSASSPTRSSAAGPSTGPRPAVWRRLLFGLFDLWERAKQERSSPREIGLSVALGALAGCSPFVGFHLGIAFVLATALRLNRLWAMVGSRVSSTPIFLATTFCEIETAHRLRTGHWAPIQWQGGLAHAKELYADWLLGAVLVGVPLAALLGAVAFAIASRWQRTSAAPPNHSPELASANRRTLAQSRLKSSE